MIPHTVPLAQELVLVGGGHTHALVLRKWGMDPLPGARLTIINPGPTAPYTGMLPGFVAGHYTRDALDIDLVRLARFAGARLILDKAAAIDREGQTVTLEGGRRIPYDLLSIDVGITSSMESLPGFREHAVAAKPLERLAEAWSRFRDGAGLARIVVIGGGVGGVELAMAMHHGLFQRGRSAQISIVERDRVLSGVSSRARRTLLNALDERDIEILEGMRVEEVRDGSVNLSNGDERASDLTVGAAGAAPWHWLAETGLALTDGYIDVNADLRTSDEHIYAAGDCAHLTHAPRPKAGVYAVRAAPILTRNLRADLAGFQRKPFRPQRDFLKLISMGGKMALLDKWGLSLSGPALWTLKDRIDRRFMDRLNDLEPMKPYRPKAAAGVSPDQPPCAGCGSKVGSAALEHALASLPASHRGDVDRLARDDAAVLNVGDGRIVATTDHLRAFTDDPSVFARIAALHAMGDIWAMGAQPQAALATIILPHMDDRLQSGWLTEIMDSATRAFADEGAVIAGGHTTLGAELTVGFAVTGTLDREPITLGGAAPGDRLILTRPIGTGTLLAGDMALEARGADIAALWEEMAVSQGAAARMLADAHAMTDVTGFGLAGHLLNMLDASGVGANLSLADIPIHPGAEDLASRGVRSSLEPANRAAVAGRLEAPDTNVAALLTDPQTAGGLLAAVTPDMAERTLGSLIDAGYRAAIIGAITDGPPRIIAC